MTPDGYWLVTIPTAAGQIGTLPVFNFVPNPALSCHDMFNTYDYLDFQEVGIGDRYQFVRNMPYDFHFWKTGYLGERLPGAHMQLFVYNGIGTPPDDIMITMDMVNSGDWTMVGEGISSLTVPMTFRMIPGRYYPCEYYPGNSEPCIHCGYAYLSGRYCFRRRYFQLIEVSPPAGYQMPMGQWQIWVNSGIPSASPPTLEITPVGDLQMPGIDPIQPFVRQTYEIQNWRNFELPLAGGSGAGMFLLAGTSLLVAAAGLMIWVRLAKRTAKTIKTRV